MKMIASRELAAHPGRVWGLLEREGSVVVTKDGAPRGIIVPTDEASLVEDIQDLVFAKARRAVRSLRAEAARTGRDRLTTAAIDAEIQAARQNRKSGRA